MLPYWAPRILSRSILTIPWALHSWGLKGISRVGAGAGIIVLATVVLVSFSSYKGSNFVFKTTSKIFFKKACVNLFLWTTLQKALN